MKPFLSFSMGIAVALLLSGAYYYYFKSPLPTLPKSIEQTLTESASSTDLGSTSPLIATSTTGTTTGSTSNFKKTN